MTEILHSASATNRPRVSVVIPVFQSERTIQKALESCLQQTVPPAEIILVDDASTDGTVGVAEGVLSRRAAPLGIPYTILRHTTNEGPSKSRNDGWARARGEWIGFLDADDAWHPAKLEKSLDVAAAHPEAVLVAHAFDVEAMPSTAMSWATPYVGDAVARRIRFAWLLLYNVMAASTVLLKRSVAERFSEDLRYNEDHDLWVRIAASHPVFYCGLPLTRRGRPLLTSGGASSALWKMRQGEIRTYVRIAGLHRSLLVLVPVLIVWSLAKYAGVWLCLRIKGAVPHVAWKR